MFNAQLTSYRNDFSKVIPIFEGINSLESCLFLKFVPKSQFSTFRPQKGSFLKNFLQKFKRKRKMNKSVRRRFRLCHFCSQCYKTFFKWANPSLFLIYFQSFQIYNTNLQQINVKKCPSAYPVYGAGILTHNFTNISHHP